MTDVAKLKEELAWIYKWVERGLYGDYTTAEAALEVIATSPDSLFRNGTWDVTHLSYADEFYKDFPKARPKS